ncbi:cation-translocating P-type ATPase [Ligilactobacillus sp. WILCCON 0076]|uniref:P-type Ca(2+) transporter n=1 Tax=Ligilactobacillus ubinensis TaxID=2876789 RepID=A0A9X2JLH2_9LACO|nr:cation-translocating P-type ATPase [Ligilactobacillus ubinensis]MCP0886605.1 cation-translocating P-type ATPase [Ligilactobacillus ubinensis]
MNKQKYHQLSVEETLHDFKTQPTGLSINEVDERLQKYGPNLLSEQKKSSLLQKFIAQFKDLMIVILMVAALIAAFAGDLSDAIIIFLVIILNAVFGVFQEAKAENAIDALKEMTTPSSRVIRSNTIQTVKSSDLVPGDIILLEAGDIIPADVRFIKAASLKVEEAALTGESVPVNKNTAAISQADISLGDRKNLGYMNTSITYGTATAVVTTTGMNTEVGHIANMLNNVKQTTTPLQKSIVHLSKILSILVLVIAALVFIIGIVADRASVLEMLLTSISLAVAAIPEGLPAIVTITLALGTQTMAKKNALIRKLPAVETLGTTEIIASDKTGTLTQNKMTVERIYESNQLEDVKNKDAKNIQSSLMQAMILANDSQQSADGLLGDPTETALIQYYLDNSTDVSDIITNYPRLFSLPFDSERKLMSVIVEKNGEKFLFIKGAVDELLKRTVSIEINNQITPLSANARAEILQVNQQMAQLALRVLAFAYRPLAEIPENPTSLNLEQELIFTGMVGMIDPERPEVKDAIRQAKSAGIKTLMITGDHKDTAAAIATRLGILDAATFPNSVITGTQLDQLSTEELNQTVENYSVYARVAPEHKVRIVKAWQQKGKIVAMTGDGVNDAPALKTADIGVGMGITGTEVSKNASDIVLADDNFATIITAVKEGRKVFANIQKAIQYLLSANLGEVLTLFLMTMLGWDIFAPAQILWINLVTDTFPAIALGIEQAESSIMQRKPRGTKSSFFSDGVLSSITYQGLLEGTLTLGVYWLAINYPLHSSQALIHADALTMAFATLGLIQIFHAFNSKSLHGTIFTKDLFANKMFNWSILISTVLLFATILIPSFNDIFKVSHLAPQQWLIVLIAGVLMLIIVELVKLIQRTFFTK